MVQAQAGAARAHWTLMLYVAAGTLLVVVTRNVFVAASNVLGLALAALVAAVLLSPVVAAVARVLPRLLAIVLVFLVAGIAALTIRSAYVTEVQDQAAFLADRGPAVAADIEERDDRVGEVARELGLVERVEEITVRIADRFGSRDDTVRETALSMPIYFVAFILTIFLLVFGPGMLSGMLARLPDRRRMQVSSALVSAARATQIQLGAALVLAIVAGLSLWAGGVWLGVPAPELLALFGGVAAVIPYLGIIVGSLPVVLAGLGVAPGWKVGVVVAVVVAGQVVEATTWRPQLDRRSLYVGPAVPVIVGVIGYAVRGFNGALVAVVTAVFALAVADFFATDEDIPTPLDS